MTSRLGLAVTLLALGSLVACEAPTGASSGPGSTPPAAATSGPVATAGPTAGPTGDAGPGGPTADDTANLTLTGDDVSGSWTLEGGTDISPTTELIAAVWTVIETDPGLAFADQVVLTLGGTIVEGTQTTSEAGIIVGISITRDNADHTTAFTHVFTSKAGECQVTMQRTSTGVSGSLTCTGITDLDGHAAGASGTFAT